MPNKKYYESHREELIAYNRLYKKTHREQLRDYDKEYRKSHRSASAASVRGTCEPRFIHYNQKHRAKRNGVEYTLTEAEWDAILEEFDHRCAYCGTQMPDGLQRDHVVPVSKGGGYTAENIVPACPDCNKRKHKRSLLMFLLTMVGRN